MAMTQQPQYTVAEFQCAIAVAKLGRVDDVPMPLRDLARGIAEQSNYIYRITSKDVDAYLAECADLDDRQRDILPHPRRRVHQRRRHVPGVPASLL